MPDHRWLVLRLDAPLAAFGGVTIDQIGVTRDFPAASMLTGLVANALGFARTETGRHQALQDRLVFAARRESENPLGLLTDSQNAQLGAKDRGWTTWGVPEGRAGASYSAPHRRRRDYHCDACITVTLRLEPTGEAPDLDIIAAALDCPARPLFIGRKPCLPSGPLLVPEGLGPRFVEAATAYDALRLVPRRRESSNGRNGDRLLATWPDGEGPSAGEFVNAIFDVADLRNWGTGLHGGTRRIVEGLMDPVEAWT